MPLVGSTLGDLLKIASVRAGLDWFRRERNWITAEQVKLCRIPAPTFFEQKRAEYMVERFRTLGWEAKLDRAGNVLAWLPGRRDHPSVALTAHLDTVLAPRSEDEIRMNGDGKLLGPGVADNGAGLAALLAIAAAWNALPPLDDSPHAPLLVANVGEEGEGNLCGMRYLCRNLETKSVTPTRIRSFLVLDGPGTDRITSRALASRRFDLTISGPGGHSWSDYGIGNPVHALGRAITYFGDHVPPGNTPRFSYNFGLVQGGSSINAIPSEARAKVDLRSESGARLDQLAGLLETAVSYGVDQENERSTGGKVLARVREIGSRPAGTLAEGAPLLAALQAVDTHLGLRPVLDCSSTDANIPLSLGLPAVSIGAGGQGGGAHTAAEWYQPEGRETGLKRVFLALCLLLNADAG